MLDEHGNLKISDFGLSSLYIGDAEDGANRTELLHTTCGTPNYVAPEVLSDQGYDGKKADVWSIGVILYVLLAGFLPFDESTIVALFAKIQNADFTYPSWFTPEARALLDKMLVTDPKVRVSLSQIKEDPWFKGPLGSSFVVSPRAASHSPRMPTDADVEAAVQHEHGDHDSDDDEHANMSEPAQLNAFDLVSHLGGFMLDRMFCPEIFYNTPGLEKLSSDKKGLGVSGAAKAKCYHFTSESTAQQLAGATVDALHNLGFSFESSRDIMTRTGVIKASFNSSKGMISMQIQTFKISPSTSLIEIKKGKGDLLEWNNMYVELVEKRIAHIINKPTIE